ncbi:TetR/AcrR family transcriptional regulator [Nitratireductor thuwali]|uniref:HTH tetR-type domain-containing protein n=1 Tax=Nitratireductor thuwali TaxID=2267699 RepID=A0ABY5MMN5_9HYPH|nr:hypothetical protein NTH_03729 [Nitratireductor thuwali]
MRKETRAERHRQIEKVAYKLVRERGYGATSMLAIAREANASNETLYRWYGGKRGLFKTMVERNASETQARLEAALSSGADPMSALEEIAPILLSMLLGEKAIALNRAAAADESGELGKTIAAAGRDRVFPLIERLIGRAIADGMLAAPSAHTATEWFLSLLIGDRQIRRAIGAIPPPSGSEAESCAADAVAAFRKLCSA